MNNDHALVSSCVSKRLASSIGDATKMIQLIPHLLGLHPWQEVSDKRPRVFECRCGATKFCDQLMGEIVKETRNQPKLSLIQKVFILCLFVISLALLTV